MQGQGAGPVGEHRGADPRRQQAVERPEAVEAQVGQRPADGVAGSQTGAVADLHHAAAGPQTLTHRLLRDHLVSGELVPGATVVLAVDQVLLEDATGTMVRTLVTYLEGNGDPQRGK